MSLSLVRVDDRLIHGQVLLMWTKVRLGDAIILLVDDKLANDQFLKTVFINAGNGLGKKVYIFTVDEAVEKIPKALNGKKNYYLISKKIEQLYELKKEVLTLEMKLFLEPLVKLREQKKFITIFIYHLEILSIVIFWKLKVLKFYLS